MAEGRSTVHKGSTPVAEDWNWQARVRSELDTNRAWQRNWGFLVEGQAGQESAPDSLSAFMKQAKQGNMSYIAGRQRESARNRRLEQQDSLDGFMRTAQTRKLPAEEFRKPLTTSQDYGWGRSLERFGAMQLVMK